MTNRRHILIIDDEQERLEQLAEAVHSALPDVHVRTWLPQRGEEHLERFGQQVANSVGLIVTDQDLTKAGGGLLGSSITSWGQDRFLPVCNFSRHHARKLPRESNFFELRVPSNDEFGRAAYVARIFLGFEQLRGHIASSPKGTRPTAALLASAMGVPALQDDLAPYLISVGSANSSFMRSIVESGSADEGESRLEFLVFVLGHALVNAVLEFPGPILNRRTLAAYCSVSDEMAEQLGTLFAAAAYTGPFSSEGEHFLRTMVDRRIDELADDLDEAPAEPAEYTRAVIAHALGGEVVPHGCNRCDGTRGGLWCPFTRRAVCNLEECSVVSSEWIPRGANLSRVERDYFDEWSPLLLGG